MDFHHGYERHRSKSMGLAPGEHYIVRGIHLTMLVSVFLNPMFGPLVVALLVLIYAGERLPHTEREALYAVNFGLTVAMLQLAAYAARLGLERFQGNPLYAVGPSLLISLLTLYFTWRAFKRTGTDALPRYKYTLRLIHPNRQWHPDPDHLRGANVLARYGLKRTAKIVDLRKDISDKEGFDEPKKRIN